MNIEQLQTEEDDKFIKNETHTEKGSDILDFDHKSKIEYGESSRNSIENVLRQNVLKDIETEETVLDSFFDNSINQDIRPRNNFSKPLMDFESSPKGFSNIKNKAINLISNLKTKISSFLFGKEDEHKLEDKKVIKQQEYYRIKERLRYEQKEISSSVIEEAKKKRNDLFEKRRLFEMSGSDFIKYFSSKKFDIVTELKQKNVGNCYAISAMYALSCSPHFEILCRSSMKRFPDGTWQVKIPLMSENGKIITIKPKEISPQWNKRFLRKVPAGEHDLDKRLILKPVEANEGFKVLEAAIIKEKFGTVDRFVSEGGNGGEVLEQLGGEKFIKYSIQSDYYDESRGIYVRQNLDGLGDNGQAYVDHFLENFDPEIHIATASTCYLTDEILKIQGVSNFLVTNHSYAISNVDKKNRMVYLANPWNTKKVMQISFNKFKENFSRLSAIRIDSSKLLKDMNSVLAKAA